MKTSHLLVATSIAISVYARFNDSWAFFARVSGRSVPLEPPELNRDTISPVMYSEHNRDPREIFLEDGLPRTTTGYVGVKGDYLVHDGRESARTFKLDVDNKVVEPLLYRCKIAGRPGEFIFVRGGTRCSPVEVLLKQYNRESGLDLEEEYDHDGPLPESDQYVPDDQIPHTLFVKQNGVYTRLTPVLDGKTLQRDYSRLKSTRFFYRDHWLYSEDAITRYVGFEKNGMLVHAPTNSPLAFSVDFTGKIVNHKFLLCDTRVHFITTIAEDRENCSLVDIYFHPYDKNGEATRPENAVSPAEVYRPYDPDLPIVFFAKHEGTYHPLTGVASDAGFDYFAYGIPERPVEFRVPKLHALSTNTLQEGLVSFSGSRFGVQYQGSDVPFEVDMRHDGMLKDIDFHACMFFADEFAFISAGPTLEFSCFPVEIHVGRYNRATHRFIKIEFHE